MQAESSSDRRARSYNLDLRVMRRSGLSLEALMCVVWGCALGSIWARGVVDDAAVLSSCIDVETIAYGDHSRVVEGYVLTIAS